MLSFDKIKQKIMKNHEIIAIFVVSAIVFYFVYDFYDWLLWFVSAIILYKTITFRINIAQWQADYRFRKNARRNNVRKID